MPRQRNPDRATAPLGEEEERELFERIGAGIGLHRAGRLDEARDAYKSVLAVQPCNASALNMLGVLAHDQRKFAEAERLIATAVAFQPRYLDAYNNLGNVFSEQGKTIEAGLCYQRALAIDPSFRPALINLGVALRRMGRIEESARLFEGLLQEHPGDSEALHNYSMVLLEKGDIDEAVSTLRHAVQLNPGASESRYALGMALYGKGRFDEAGEVFLRWSQEHPDHPIPQHMARAYSTEESAVPERASNDYVRAIFDNFATSFERVLERLDYRAPSLISSALAQDCGVGKRDLVILDAGCGTGLCSQFLRPHASRLVGVDLSHGMLAEAGATEQYDELVEAELTQYLADSRDTFDLVAAADVLCYFGALEAVFRGVASRLRPGGRFVFTLELRKDFAPTGYHLNFHGRYSHMAAYVERALREAGLGAISMKEVELRIESGRPVLGLLITCAAGLAPRESEATRSAAYGAQAPNPLQTVAERSGP